MNDIREEGYLASYELRAMQGKNWDDLPEGDNGNDTILIEEW